MFCLLVSVCYLGALVHAFLWMKESDIHDMFMVALTIVTFPLMIWFVWGWLFWKLRDG